jgi:hypothetical protein
MVSRFGISCLLITGVVSWSYHGRKVATANGRDRLQGEPAAGRNFAVWNLEEVLHLAGAVVVFGAVEVARGKSAPA